MQFVDTHAHLYQPDFNGDIDQVMGKALGAMVVKFLLPNIDSASLAPMLELSLRFPDHCHPMIGLHPTSVKENYHEELNIVSTELVNNKDTYVAIGETGIDLYWDQSYLKEQQAAFRYQIELAKKWDLPIVIHARESFNEIFDVLDEMNDENLKGVFHSFSGDLSQAEKALGYGFYLGIGGIVTFKNARLGHVVKDLPLEKIVLETDSPYLSPAPHRGKRNESQNIPLIANKIALLKNLSIEEISKSTTDNAIKLFNLKDV